MNFFPILSYFIPIYWLVFFSLKQAYFSYNKKVRY
nr:MAG TPA: hypothetical protein [Caudoviricetes sp.]